MDKQKYDVAIVGGGVGGLCAGALLAKDGYRVLLTEKRGTLGGRWSTREVEGFKLTTGVIAVYKNSLIEDVFNQVGKEFQAVVCPLLYYRIKGKDYEVSAKGAVGKMLGIIGNLEIGGIAGEVATEKIKEGIRAAVKQPEEQRHLTFKQWLSQYTDSRLVYDLFDVLNVTVLCARNDEIPAAEVFSFFAKIGQAKDTCFAPRGNVENANLLGDVIRENGDVWLNCPTRQIIVEGGKAKGIVCEQGGKEIDVESKVVITDVGPKATVKLAGEKNYDKEYLETMQARLRPTPVIMSHIASDKPLWMESGEPANLVIVGARRITGVIPLTNTCPELAPKGQHLTYIVGAPLKSQKMNRQEEIRANDLDIEEHLPDFKKHGRILKRFMCDVDSEFPEMRTWPGYDMPRETPIEYLYVVGDACKSPGLVGASAAAESGVRVAEIVKGSIKPS